MKKILLRMGFSNVKSFQNLQLLNEYLQVQKFPINLVYFRAAWNPACALTDQHIRQLADSHPIEIAKVDSNIAPKIAQHYGVKSEPQFVFCYQGDQIVRQIGPNYDGLLQKYQKIQQIEKDDKTNQGWSAYGHKFQKFYKEKLKDIYKK